jgi:hypothetical protein
VLELTVAERAESAHDLVGSLNGAGDANAIEEWGREVLRRPDEIDARTAKLTIAMSPRVACARVSNIEDARVPRTRGSLARGHRVGTMVRAAASRR